MALDNNVPLAANQIAADLAAINANWELLVPLSGNLGTPSAGVLTNCTGLPAAGVVGTAALAGAKIKQTNAIENESKLLQTEDIFSDFVVTGLLPATSATTLISDISAGHAYATGVRVNKTATSNTYTASVDTYVDISSAGVYTFPEVALGAAAPAVTADSIRLAKVVTDADNITGVTDLRELKISVAPAFATPDLGTPSACVLTNCTGLPVATGLAAGIFTNTGQPAFLVKPSATLSNVTGDATFYTVVFATEIFDQNNNFVTSTFTAPVTGRYQLSLSLFITGLAAANTFILVYVNTSNQNYPAYYHEDTVHIGTLMVNFSMLVDMDAADTATVSLDVRGSTKIIGIGANSFFSGFLAC